MGRSTPASGSAARSPSSPTSSDSNREALRSRQRRTPEQPPVNRSRLDTLETLAVLVTDSLAILAAYIIAYKLRFQTDILPFLRLPSRFVQYSTALVIIGCFLAAFTMNRLYRQRRSLSPVDEFTRVVGGVSVGTLFAVAVVSF